ncbi:MAG: zeta toxin family protein [Bacteroidales bacterium]|nr:zeta toxin family protein [Bacteroidales bacterium]MBR3828499.1 zeta toxin family protein [Bacteroidales bacterium]MBR4230151.1 zeta toxin family protein [Bacteroidales bacterium]
MNKNLYIIAGCNGAGKTTASYTILPEILECKEFVNADEIARGLSPFNPNSTSIEAGKLMLKRIRELLGRDESFAIETTLATRSYINLVRQAQSRGYAVTLLFFWLRTPELALQRIAERVKSGGHDIPTATARRRYVSGINNLFNLYVPEVDYWMLYDNSSSPRIAVARGGRQLETTIYDQETFNTIKNYV